MTSITLKIVQRAILAAAFVSTAAMAQPASHQDVTVPPAAQENVWGARTDIPGHAQQARATENVWGAQLDVPESQLSVASTPTGAQAPATQGRD